MLPDQTPPDADKQVTEAEESSVTHLSAEIIRLREEAVMAREKIKDLQEQVRVNFCHRNHTFILD